MWPLAIPVCYPCFRQSVRHKILSGSFYVYRHKINHQILTDTLRALIFLTTLNNQSDIASALLWKHTAMH